jgi:hypothetical protein
MKEKSYSKKMRTHYMLRGERFDAKGLKSFSSRLENANYYSVLLTFDSRSPDYFIKSAAALIPGNKLKYMIALRPYHMTPQLCAMMTEGYNEIDPDRLIINWVAGDFDSRKDEPLQVNVLRESEPVDNIIKRTTFLRNFVKEYNYFDIISKKPEMVFSGFSDYTLETTRMFNGTSLCMIDDYRRNITKFEGIKNKMVCLNPIVLKDNSQADEYKKIIGSLNPRSVDTTIVGDMDTVKKKIIDLKNEGITDILLDTNRPDFFGMHNQESKNNDRLVNELVREISGGYIDV